MLTFCFRPCSLRVMKTLFSQLFALVALTGGFVGGLTTDAQARLGETREQLVERYGEPLREEKVSLAASDSAELFFKDNVEVLVEFKDERAWLVAYRTHRLTSEMEAQFRDANDGEDGMADWREPTEHLMRTYWRTSDGSVTGVTYIAGNSKIFRFCTDACLLKLVEARKEMVDNASEVTLAAANEDEPAGDSEEEAQEEPKDENPF